MKELLPHLLRRGLTGKATPCDQRFLEFFAWGPIVNRRIFGQPLSGVLVYYAEEYRSLILGLEDERRAGSR